MVLYYDTIAIDLGNYVCLLSEIYKHLDLFLASSDNSNDWVGSNPLIIVGLSSGTQNDDIPIYGGLQGRVG